MMQEHLDLSETISKLSSDILIERENALKFLVEISENKKGLYNSFF